MFDILARYSIVVGLATSALALGGCQTSSGLQQPAKDFVAATASLTQSEGTYFDQIQAASDAMHRLHATKDYVLGESAKSVQDELDKTDDFSTAKQHRMAVMTQLQNYAAEVNAIAGGADASWVATDAQNITSDVKSLSSGAGIKLDTNTVGLVQTAVTDLGQDIIDNKSAKELKALAKDAQGPIDQIAKMIQADNDAIAGTKKGGADGFQSDLSLADTDDIYAILATIENDKHVTAVDRLNVMLAVPNLKPGLITEGQTVLAALKKLQDANNKLAAGSTTNDVSTLWQQAQALAQSAASKPAATK